MKAKITYPIFLLLIVALTSCKKEFPNDPLAIKDLSVSSCKTKGRTTKGIDPEYITIKTTDDYYLLVNHINSMFNCQPGQITVTTNVLDNVVSMDENESSSLANCICPYDLEFKLGSIKIWVLQLEISKIRTDIQRIHTRF